MSTTINSTLPLSWDSSISYNKGDTVSYGNGVIYKSLVQGNLNHRPNSSSEYWEPLDIYKKNLTDMPHGSYSGDENIWQRDVVNIDTNGYLYINNENTGINVKGRDGKVTFDSLTPEQIETLRGPQGEQGEPGPAGPTGPQGPMGEVILTPEQIAALKGDEGKSAYEIWLEEGHVGTEEDFLQWLTTQSVTLDTELLQTSTNPVQNQAIYNAFKSYQIYLNRVMSDYLSRLINLENRLKAIYADEEQEFRFGVTESGQYGYYNADNRVIPFDYNSQEVTQSTAVLPGSLVGASQFAYQEVIDATETITNANDDLTFSGFRGTPSETNDLDSDGVMYAVNPQVMSFEDFAEAKTYLYKNGLNLPFKPTSFTLYSMTENSTNISSNEAENIEGFMMSVDAASYGHTLCVVVAPKIEGTTVNYQIGMGTTGGTSQDPQAYESSLPSVVNGTNRYSYTNGSFNTETTISYNINTSRKTYFASTSGAGYIIKQIYLE